MTPLMGDTLKISAVTGGNNSWWMFTMGLLSACHCSLRAAGACQVAAVLVFG